jgi:hypothetical protein
MNTLPKTQADVLEAIKKNGNANYMHYMGRFGGDYWHVPGYGRCTSQVKALIKKGYLATKQLNIYGDAEACLKETVTPALATGREEG